MATKRKPNGGLTSETERLLLEQYVRSVKAGAPDLQIRNSLVDSHGWLIQLEARQIHAANNRHVQIDDLVAAGYVGLIEAIETFSPRSKNRLSTYAWWPVRNKMHEFVKFSRWHGHISDVDYRASMHLHRALAKMPVQFNHSLDYVELAKLLEWPVGKCERLVPALKSTISLETPLTKNGQLRLADTLSDRDVPTPEILVERSHLKALVHQSLQVLNNREREAVLYEFFDVVPEALKKARSAARKRSLKDHYRYASNAALKKLRSSVHVRTALEQSSQVKSR